MSIKDLLGKLLGRGASKVGDAGLNTLLQGLQKLLPTAEGNDKISLTDIINLVKKALENKDELLKVIQKCLPIAQNIGNSDLKNAVLKLLK